MPKYHFSIGNSSEGAIGLSARVTGSSREDALATLLDSLQEAHDISPDDPFVDYINVYINHEAITVEDINEVEGDE